MNNEKFLCMILEDYHILYKKYNKLQMELNSLLEIKFKMHHRECLYQSTIQNLKNDLGKLYRSIDITPHSSCEEYKEMSYSQYNKYKEVIESIESYCKEQNLKHDMTACTIIDMIDKIKKDNDE